MILFDTCAMLHIVGGMKLSGAVEEIVAAAVAERAASVSIMSAWEIGKLASHNRVKLPLPPLKLFETFVASAGLTEAPLTPAILVASSFLPGDIHRAPWDRILIATARETGARILTCDRALLAYSAQGHVRTIAY